MLEYLMVVVHETGEHLRVIYPDDQRYVHYTHLDQVAADGWRIVGVKWLPPPLEYAKIVFQRVS